MNQYRVERAEAAKFAQVWNHGGIQIPMQDVHIDFATAFANVVLRNFIDMCKQQAAQPKPAPEKKLIVEA